MELYRISKSPWFFGKGLWCPKNPYSEWASLRGDSTDAFEKTKTWLNAYRLVGYDKERGYIETKWRRTPIIFQKDPNKKMKKAVKDFEKNIYDILPGVLARTFLASYEKAKDEAALKCLKKYGKVRVRDMDEILYSFTSYEPSEEDQQIIWERQKEDDEFSYLDLLEERKNYG